MKAPRGRRLALSTAALALAVLSVAAWLPWPHLRFWWLFEPLGLNAQGLPEYRHRQTGIVMVRVPGGTFWMGAQKDDPNGPNFDPDAEDADGPVHEVALRPFLAGKYEVTQAEWQRVMGDNPSHFKGSDRPVEQASWDDCQEFCRRAELNLPTEAQWECACRGRSPGACCFGADAKLLPEYAWYLDNANRTTHAVGKRGANGFGLHDVHGNVFEWCKDICGEGFYATADAGGLDPLCRSGSECRVMRGGAWGSVRSGGCRSAIRAWHDPAFREENIGFRVAFYPLP